MLHLASVSAQSTCQDRCGENDVGAACQCNMSCESFGDCCSDYQQICFSCKDRCQETYSSSKPCQCNVDCNNFGNCCSDYDIVCFGGGSSVTDQDIIDFMEQIYSADVNSIGDQIVYNTAGSTLFTSVPSNAFDGQTYSTLLALRDNFESDATVNEDDTAAEDTEIQAFLNAIMATAVMQEAETFAINNSLLFGAASFRGLLQEVWFTHYSRSAGPLGSSGFEGTFLGELNNGSLVGYNSWVSFYLDESQALTQYLGCIGDLNLGAKASILTMDLSWMGSVQTQSSMWIGASPELEMAAYTICFLSRGNTNCDVMMNGVSFVIDTSVMGGPTGQLLIRKAAPIDLTPSCA